MLTFVSAAFLFPFLLRRGKEQKLIISERNSALDEIMKFSSIFNNTFPFSSPPSRKQQKWTR
jgi:hypothetical protein